MLKTLLKKQLFEINRGFFYDRKKGKAHSKASSIALIIAYVVLMVGVIGGAFAFFAMSICGPLLEAEMGWMYFAIFSLIGAALGVFGSVFNTYSGLYLAKDNDLLLSLPIPVRYILISRLLGVYLMGLMFSGVVLLPAVVVYFLTARLTAAAVAGCVLLLLLVSIFVLLLSCLLGWVVAKISLKLKNRSFITVFVSLLFLGAYYFLYFKAQSWISALVVNAAAYGEKLRSSAYPLYLLGRVGEGDWWAMLLVAAVVLGAFALTWLVLSHSFLKIATATGKTAKTAYRGKTVRARTTSRALFGKEMRRFTASPNYMLNCGLGTLFLVVAGVLLLMKGRDVTELLQNLFSAQEDFVPVLLTAGVCMLASMNDMAAPSVSLEGRSLWLVQSLPVTSWQVLRAKLSVQLLLTGVPALFCAACAAAVVSASLPQRLLLFLVSLLFVFFSACFALFLGIKKPNLAWTNEITPIKQSMSVLLALLGAWVYAIVLIGVYLLAGWRLGGTGYLAVFALFTAALSVLLYLWLKKRGSALFAAL